MDDLLPAKGDNAAPARAAIPKKHRPDGRLGEKTSHDKGGSLEGPTPGTGVREGLSRAYSNR